MNPPSSKKKFWVEYHPREKAWSFMHGNEELASVQTREVRSNNEVYETYRPGTKLGYVSFGQMSGSGSELARRMIFTLKWIFSPRNIKRFERVGIVGIMGVTQTDSLVNHLLRSYPTHVTPGDRLGEARYTMFLDTIIHDQHKRSSSQKNPARHHSVRQPFPFRLKPMRAVFVDFDALKLVRRLSSPARKALLTMYREDAAKWHHNLPSDRGPLNFIEFNTDSFNGRPLRIPTRQNKSKSPRPRKNRRR